jgi:hypothetical protein
MAEAAAYWLDNGWGWGEHLSDGYCRVCLDEVSLLLLLARRLPDPLRETYRRLLGALLDIEDAYGDGPRVPALRSYAFQESPRRTPYRKQIRPLEEGELPGTGNHPALGPLLFELGWHDLAPAQAPPKRSVRVACFAGAVAQAHVEADLRLGSVSRFPVMDTAEHPTWGLAWQCFPVALWAERGDWGFLQWVTREEDEAKAHPAVHRRFAYIPKALTSTVRPPIVGETHSLQRDGELLVVRRMPRLAAAWTEVTDRFRVVSASGEGRAEKKTETWSQLTLGCGGRSISVQRLNLLPCEERYGANEHGGADWGFSYSGEKLSSRRGLIGVWGISLSGEVTEAPEVTSLADRTRPASEEERSWEIRWRWPATAWRVIVTARGETPLLEA